MQSVKDMSDYRLEKAKECLSVARILLQSEKYDSATNRSYYCIFHCMRSVIALENVDFKKHSALISYFRQHYIKTGIFDKRLSDIITVLFRMREKSDYDDFYIIAKKDVEVQVENAGYFLAQIESYLSALEIKTV
jgi:uncharacterized protein (UPF0332 family)